MLTSKERREYAQKYRAEYRRYHDRDRAHNAVFPPFRGRLLMNAKLDPNRGAGWWTNEVRESVLNEIAEIERSVKR